MEGKVVLGLGVLAALLLMLLVALPIVHGIHHVEHQIAHPHVRNA